MLKIGRKVQQEQNRYEREMKKFQTAVKKGQIIPETARHDVHAIQNMRAENDPMNMLIQTVRDDTSGIKHAQPDTDNNMSKHDNLPLETRNNSVPTEELNAWLDFQLNHTSSVDEGNNQPTSTVQAQAANQDDNKPYYRPDETRSNRLNIPTGFQLTGMRTTQKQASAIAKQLIDDDDLSVCRNTGIMKKRAPRSEISVPPRRRAAPPATITRPPPHRERGRDYDRDRDNRHSRHNNRKASPGSNRSEPPDTEFENFYDQDNLTEIDDRGSLYDHHQAPRSKSFDIKQHNARRNLENDDEEYYYDNGRYQGYDNDNYDDRWTQQTGRRYRSPSPPRRNDRYERMDRAREYGRESWRPAVNNYDDSRGRRFDSEPPARRYRTGQSPDSRSSSSDDSRSKRKVRKIKSGINAKPTSSVREQLRYPHFSLGQVSGFIGLNIPFHNLTFEQFVAGELTTIASAPTRNEREGRTELLQRISLWKLRSGVTWPQIRNTYAHIIRMVENREIGWRTDWDRFERHIYDKIAETKKVLIKDKKGNDPVWFCKAYQRPDGCPRESSHWGKVGTQNRLMQHICATCWLRDRVKRHHPESSDECPHKNNA